MPERSNEAIDDFIARLKRDIDEAKNTVENALKDPETMIQLVKALESRSKRA